MFKRSVIASAISGLAGVACLASASAQEGPASQAVSAQAERIEEVVVTARRKEENLQDVPISVTVMSGEQLAAKSITDISGLATQLPAVQIESISADPRVFSIGIRGLRTNSFLLFDDPPVGTYFAETVLAHPYGFGFTLYDIESLQVLKGPQGTLFGRNTTGGAMLVEPNKPTLDAFGGTIKLSVGNYNMQRTEGVLNIPFNDTVALRVGGVIHKRDGYTTNVLSGQKLDEIKYDAFRASLLVKPNANLSSLTLFDMLDQNSAPNSFHLLGTDGPVNGAIAGLFPGLTDAARKRGIREVAGIIGSGLPGDAFDPSRCAINPNLLCRPSRLPESTLKVSTVINNTTWETGNGLTFKNILSYRDMKSANNGTDLVPLGGGINGAAVGIQANQNNKMRQITEEFQIQGKAFDDRLDWITGFFYMKESGSERAPSYVISSAAWRASQGHGENQSTAIFAQGSYALTEKLKTTVGLRVTRDKRFASDESVSSNGTVCLQKDTASGSAYPINNCALVGSKTWTEPTYTVSLEYKATPDMMYYIAHRHGYKSGGFSLRSHLKDRWQYDPEYIDDLEAGMKADWYIGDVPVRTNLAVYYAKIKDQQVQVTDPNNTTVTFINNAGRSETHGAEFEFTILPTRGLEISGFYAYNRGKYKEYTDPGSGRDLTYVPYGNGARRHSAGLSMSYTTLPLANNLGTLTYRADVSYMGKSYATPGPGKGWVDNVFTLGQDSYTLLNLRVDWKKVGGSPIDMGLWVQNATDEEYLVGANRILGVLVGNWSPPRMFGLDLSYKF